jgi:ubiquitin carboxyl-terminal hydrolase L5
VKNVQFEELIALDADYLRQLSPVYGVIFLFRYPTGEKANSDGTPKDGQFDHAAAENLFFAAQTIQNACGTQALLSVLLNKDGEIDVGTQLREFKDFTSGFPAEFRLVLLLLLCVSFVGYNNMSTVAAKPLAIAS